MCTAQVDADGEKLSEGFLLDHDAGQFMGVLAGRLVTEIQTARGGSGSSTQTSLEVLSILASDGPGRHGRSILICMAAMKGDSGAVEAVAALGLPSILVECLYSFFELPEDDRGEVGPFPHRFSILCSHHIACLSNLTTVRCSSSLGHWIAWYVIWV